MSVAQAADRLGVSERRVRQLLASGELSTEKVAGRHLLSVDSVRRRSMDPPASGRPLSPGLAWALLGALSRAAGADPRLAMREAAPDRKLRWRLVRVVDVERLPSEW